MKKLLSLSLILFLWPAFYGFSATYPEEVYVEAGDFHVQGIAYDKARNCMYMSFTNAFFKTDMQGKVVASVSGINGHLGAITFDPESRMVYATLEFKDDRIGRNISDNLGEHRYSREESTFNIACIDVDKLVSMNMKQSDVMTLVRVNEACDDYKAVVTDLGVSLEHRYACSGIDGITIAPSFGDGCYSDKKYLYVAYGIYGDNSRCDNNYNILLCYDLKSVVKLARAASDGVDAQLKKPVEKYFVFCGNTKWGVQNLAYDPSTGKMFMAVYKGSKPQFPNYSLFALDIAQTPFKGELKEVLYQKGKVTMLSLSTDGLKDEATGISGWNFEWGSTGICSLGGGYFYISQKGKRMNDEGKGVNFCKAVLYRWNADAQNGPFNRVEK